MPINYSEKKLYISTAIIMIMALLALSFSIASDNRRFYEEQVKLAQAAVSTTQTNLQQFFLQKRQMLAAIVELEQPLLNEMVKSPDNLQNVLRLQRVIENRLDDFFSFMLTDKLGLPLLENKTLLVGKQCQQALKKFSDSKALFQENLKIHGNSINNYHFDVMRKINNKEDSAIFFVSFRLNRLFQLLKMISIPGQSILIVKDFNPETVVVSSKGAYKSPTGESKLNPSTLSSVLFQSSMSGTDWRILALPHETLFSEHNTFLIKRAVIIFLSLFFIMVFFLWRVRIEKQVALSFESQLTQANALIDKKNNQQALQQNIDENCFKSAFLGAPYGMIITNSEGIIESVNHQTEMMFDYKQEQLIGKNVDCLVPDRYRQAHQGHREQYHHKMKRKIMGSGRYLYGKKQSGEELPIEIGLNPIEHSSGTKIIVSITDISTLIKAQEKLTEEHERAVVTLSSIGDGVITTNNDGLIDSINSMAEKMTGWSSTEAIGQPITDIFNIINEKTGDSLDAAIISCLQNNTIVQERLETVLMNKNGMSIPIQESAAPIHDTHGNMIGAVLVFHDVTQMRNYAHEIEYHANHDVLTGLLNRREFDCRLTNALKREAENNYDNVLLYLDIDRFKIVNDTAGHLAGDELLKQVSEIILGKLRSRDTFSRLGGDEFGILLEHCSLDTGHKIALDICKAIENFSFFWNKQMFSVSVSIGMIGFQSESSPDELLSKVDAACYTAKKSGRNRIQIYDEKAAKKHDESHVVNMLTHAFENDLMILYQQRIQAVNPLDEHQHCEVLVRMLGDNNEIIPPDVFLPTAERYGLATTLDRWVIRQVFKWLTEHGKKLAPSMTMSINLSAQSITDELFGEFVREQFILYKISPEHICFEITETSAMYDLDKAISLITDLKKIGCQFSLDDFGSGHAAYAQLKHLPVDYLKIDGSLVKDIINDQIDFSIVRSVNEVGHVLGMKTIAEYVENKEIVEKLTAINVDYLQGYEIARPSPLDDLLK